ncbi:GNAT family N-acetyltransferase [Psychroserpens sp. S379A]|uniref:GNAT family N-acetyltransferase n=1 Tax=Psychroserpens sp. S379A TaxID=3415137 RepID=UPI003C7D6BF8
MRTRPIEHQFEFWTNLGKAGRYIHQVDGYNTLLSSKGTWPSKIFNLHNTNTSNLKHNILKHNLPNAIALDSSNELNQLLIKNGFKKTSVVEGMSLKVSSNMVFEQSSNIVKVEDEQGIRIFSNIASEAFGYNIHSISLMGLLKDVNTQLFIGKYKDQFVSCGILFLDKSKHSGLHMIGANKQFRGLGLGKEMTQHLLFKAIENKSSNIHLVASKFGAPIYRKYGFLNKGYLNTYTLEDFEIDMKKTDRK